MTRVVVNPDLLRWARERARMDTLELEARFSKLGDWEHREISPTLKQLEAYARATHVPVGYLFLAQPPEEPLPIPDFRTVTGGAPPCPSRNLLDTIYACQERQAWYREFAQVTGQPPSAFVGSVSTRTDPVDAAVRLRRALAFDLDERRDCRTWTEALRRFLDRADGLGVLVMVTGVVRSNNRRRLDPEEFCGFALADDLAPLVFINGADSKAAQVFTLAHALAHIWLGVSALSDAGPASTPDNAVELWCSQVAAELLASRVGQIAATTRGLRGDPHRTPGRHISRRFVRALIESTLEGGTLYRDAFRMLGISKTEAFNEFGRGVNFNI